VANAKLQAARVAKERNMSIDQVDQLIVKHTEGRAWGFLGEKVVDVLQLDLDLDRQG
jgi:K+-transporting ATPase ATPase C chain